MVALHGPSGSGKTTLLKLAATLLSPEQRHDPLRRRDLSSFSEDDASDYLLRDVGFVYQNFRLMPRVSALENASIKLLLGGVGRREAQAQALEWLERLGLGDRVEPHPEQLSGGERQRVAIAQALAGDPRLILADEPTGNLDSARSREIVALLAEIAHERGAGVLLVTHDTEAAQLADRASRCATASSTSTAARRRGCRASEPPADPRALLRPYALLYLYRRRLRVHAAQELLRRRSAIAIAVALVFAATVAESSIAGSSGEVVRRRHRSRRACSCARAAARALTNACSRGSSACPGSSRPRRCWSRPRRCAPPNGRHTTIDLAGTDTSLAVLDGLAETLPLAALQPGHDRSQQGERGGTGHRPSPAPAGPAPPGPAR